MTNEEKVATIVGRARAMLPMMRSQLGDSVTGYAEYFKRSLLNMADWKDQQFKEYMEKKRDKWQSAYEETQDSDYYAVYNTLAEIINELFKED